MGLAGVGEGLGVHVLVKKGQQVEVDLLVGQIACELRRSVVEDPVHVIQSLAACEERQVPARVVSDRHGVVEGVGLLLQ